MHLPSGPKVKAIATFKMQPKVLVLGHVLNATTAFTLGHVLNGVISPGLGPCLKKCSHRPISPIVTGFRPH